MAHVCKHTKKLIRTLEKRNLIRVEGKGEQFKLWPTNKNLSMRTVHFSKGGKSFKPLQDWAKKDLGFQGDK